MGPSRGPSRACPHFVDTQIRATHDFNLYRDGAFYDLRQDIEENRPLAVASLGAETLQVAHMRQGVLDRYKDARPAHLVQTGKKKQNVRLGPGIIGRATTDNQPRPLFLSTEKP